MKISIIIVVFVVLFSPLFLKAKDLDEKIKLTQISFEYPKNASEILSLFTSYFYTTVTLTISNFSDFKIKINDLNLSLYTLKGNLFCEQYEPLSQPIEILPHQNTQIKVKYQIDYTKFIALYKDNNLQGKIIETIKKLATEMSLGTEIYIKGVVIIKSFTLNINEKFDI